MKMTFLEIYNIYKKTGLKCNTIELLASENKVQRQMAIDELRTLNLKTEDDVLLYIISKY